MKKHTQTLPLELIREVLLRLPVRSVLRFRCVCKSWLPLISDPQFRISHYDLAAAPTHRLLLRSNNFYIESVDIEAELEKDSSAVHLILPPSSPPRHRFEYDYYADSHDKPDILGSCRGLILLYYPRNSDHIIWNPSLGVQKRLPYLAYDVTFCPLYGFGYDPSTDDYLLIVIGLHDSEHYKYDTDGSEDDECKGKCQIFSFKTDSWYIVDIFVPYKDLGGKFRAGSLFGDILHWLVFSKDKKVPVILAFDLVQRSFSEIPLFDNFAMEKYGVDSLRRVMGGCLSVSCSVHDGATDEIWVMKEYKVQSSWTRSVVIPSSGFSPICINKDGGILGSNICGRLEKLNDKGELLEHLIYGGEQCLCSARLQSAVYMMNSVITVLYFNGRVYEENDGVIFEGISGKYVVLQICDDEDVETMFESFQQQNQMSVLELYIEKDVAGGSMFHSANFLTSCENNLSNNEAQPPTNVSNLHSDDDDDDYLVSNSYVEESLDEDDSVDGISDTDDEVADIIQPVRIVHSAEGVQGIENPFWNDALHYNNINWSHLDEEDICGLEMPSSFNVGQELYVDMDFDSKKCTETICYEGMIREDPSIKISLIQERINSEFAYKVSYKKVWLAKQKAIALEYDDWEESYAKLSSWLTHMQNHSPGSYFQILHDDSCLLPNNFNRKFNNAKQKEMLKKLGKISFIMEKWTMTYDREGRRYSHMTTNLSECINKILKDCRNIPITALLKSTYSRCRKYFVDRGRQARRQLNEGQIYCSKLVKELRKNQEETCSHIVRVGRLEKLNDKGELLEHFIYGGGEWLYSLNLQSAMYRESLLSPSSVIRETPYDPWKTRECDRLETKSLNEYDSIDSISDTDDKVINMIQPVTIVHPTEGVQGIENSFWNDALHYKNINWSHLDDEDICGLEMSSSFNVGQELYVVSIDFDSKDAVKNALKQYVMKVH
ncbi:F-box/kelch-repeat protein [Glycine soja]